MVSFNQLMVLIKMKKYIILSFLFLLATTPIFAKSSADTSSQQSGQGSSQVGSQTTSQNATVTSGKTNTITPTNQSKTTPTGNQVQNQNEVQTQNQGEEQQLSVQTQENEQLNQTVDSSITKVSDQVQELINTVGAKSGIGQEVKEIAQNQIKLQDEIKATIGQFNSRSTLAKFFFGSDKKSIQTMTQQIEQNRLMILQFEELKLQTKNTGDLQQLEETIQSMVSQNTFLQEKINQENQIKGMFGWLINLFQK